MIIIWNEEKNEWLKINRHISFEEIANKIINNDTIHVTDNLKLNYLHQKVYFVLINNYVWVIPFIKKDNKIKLITAYPCRKANKKYGRKRT
jgi:uncharacterized DUF497 family protein